MFVRVIALQVQCTPDVLAIREQRPTLGQYLSSPGVTTVNPTAICLCPVEHVRILLHEFSELWNFAPSVCLTIPFKHELVVA